MEAILCLRRHPLTTSTLLFTSNFSNPSTISRHVSFRHSSHYIGTSHGHTQALSRVTCTIDRRNNGDEDNKPKATVGVALALACVLGIISCGCSIYPKAMAAVSLPRQQPQQQERAIPSGKQALGSFLDMLPVIISGEGRKHPARLWHKRRPQPGDREFKSIKDEALTLLKYGNSKAAEETVTKELEAYKMKDDVEMIFMLDMLMVEILIIEGKFEEALRRQCIAHVESQKEGTIPSDRRISLYKAILHTMLSDDNNTEQAKHWWDEFKNHLDPGSVGT